MFTTQEKEQETSQKVIRDTLSRIINHPGVEGYMFVKPKDGKILEVSGFNKDEAVINLYAIKLHAFTMLAQSIVRTIDHSEDLTFLRMRMGHREVLVVPDFKEYILIVVQGRPEEAVTSNAEETKIEVGK